MLIQSFLHILDVLSDVYVIIFFAHNEFWVKTKFLFQRGDFFFFSMDVFTFSSNCFFFTLGPWMFLTDRFLLCPFDVLWVFVCWHLYAFIHRFFLCVCVVCACVQIFSDIFRYFPTLMKSFCCHHPPHKNKNNMNSLCMCCACKSDKLIITNRLSHEFSRRKKKKQYERSHKWKKPCHEICSVFFLIN